MANGSADGTCPSSSSFSGGCGAHHDVVSRFVLCWLKLFVDGDERYRQFLVQVAELSTYETTLN